jgi:hypothetical protein
LNPALGFYPNVEWPDMLKRVLISVAPPGLNQVFGYTFGRKAFGQKTFGQIAFGQKALGQKVFGQKAFGQMTTDDIQIVDKMTLAIGH